MSILHLIARSYGNLILEMFVFYIPSLDREIPVLNVSVLTLGISSAIELSLAVIIMERPFTSTECTNHVSLGFRLTLFCNWIIKKIQFSLTNVR